mmetsp:Transcript_23775/g.28696  ORF Transcript_23775/g.28696 Transcript_23775/m.28696 type:complete len:313 (-) Transcript_23775:24-962(-)
MAYHPVELDWVSVVLSFALISVSCGLSYYLKLNLEVSLLIAAVRSVLQLSLLSYILVPIFKANEYYVVLPYCIFMTAFSALEADTRQSFTYNGMLLHAFGSIFVASSTVMLYGVVVLLKLDPLWDAHYVIPIFGMLLGNSLTSISVALSTSLEEFAQRHDQINFRLSRGADKWEASKPILQRAIKIGTTPLINQMSVAGLVAIPGMMTGQILGGTPPVQAARYQITVLFLIGASAALSSCCIFVLMVNALFDSNLCLKPDFLRKKTKFGSSFQMISSVVKQKGEGVVGWVKQQVAGRTTSSYDTLQQTEDDM